MTPETSQGCWARRIWNYKLIVRNPRHLGHLNTVLGTKRAGHYARSSGRCYSNQSVPSDDKVQVEHRACAIGRYASEWSDQVERIFYASFSRFFHTFYGFSTNLILTSCLGACRRSLIHADHITKMTPAPATFAHLSLRRIFFLRGLRYVASSWTMAIGRCGVSHILRANDLRTSNTTMQHSSKSLRSSL